MISVTLTKMALRTIFYLAYISFGVLLLPTCHDSNWKMARQVHQGGQHRKHYRYPSEAWKSDHHRSTSGCHINWLPVEKILLSIVSWGPNPNRRCSSRWSGISGVNIVKLFHTSSRINSQRREENHCGFFSKCTLFVESRIKSGSVLHFSSSSSCFLALNSSWYGHVY